jgi:peptidoglycan/xylan/chitin deacetylase (PgdA/CDA1 family)
MEWFNGAKCVVCLTFDFDADVSWRNILRRHNIQRNNPVVLSQGEYGAKAGVPRILKILERLNLKAGFFITGEVVEKYPEVTREIYSNGHEIGHHGYSHRNLASCTLSEEREELEMGFKALEEVINIKPIGYRAPAADMSENTFNLLSEYGISYDSSMMGDDLPHFIKMVLLRKLPKQLYSWRVMNLLS